MPAKDVALLTREAGLGPACLPAGLCMDTFGTHPSQPTLSSFCVCSIGLFTKPIDIMRPFHTTLY